MSLKNLIIVARLMLALALVSVIVTLSWPHAAHAQAEPSSGAAPDADMTLGHVHDHVALEAGAADGVDHDDLGVVCSGCMGKRLLTGCRCRIRFF